MEKEKELKRIMAKKILNLPLTKQEICYFTLYGVSTNELRTITKITR